MIPQPLPNPREHPLSEFFAPLRVTREERRRPRGSRPTSCALLTRVRNEPVFLPIWLMYYSRWFAPEDIYVLDHDTTDGSTSIGGFNRVPVGAGPEVDNRWMFAITEEYQHALIEDYDAVLITDVDELVIPRPEWGDLGEYLARFAEPYVNCLGYEILHLDDRESPLDPARPIFDQRGYWYSNDAYNKPLLATEAMSWDPGFHARADGEITLDPDLYLVHLHRVDYELCRARHHGWIDRRWVDHDLETGLGKHMRVTEDEPFRRWFYGDTSFEHIDMVLEPIPREWRGAL